MRRYIGITEIDGLEAMRQPDAPEDGWYVIFVDEDGEEETVRLGPLPKYPPTGILGLFHDDYFPPPEGPARLAVI